MIREKINEALTDMPQNPQILELLEGTRKKHSQPPYYNMHNIPWSCLLFVKSSPLLLHLNWQT